jgi:excisionase family DNA binding protein
MFNDITGGSSDLPRGRVANIYGKGRGMPVLTVAQLAAEWQCSTTLVYDKIASGELPAIRLGGKLIRIKRTAKEAYECNQLIRSGSSPANDRMAPDTGASASSTLTHQAVPDTVVSRLERHARSLPKQQLSDTGKRVL